MDDCVTNFKEGNSKKGKIGCDITLRDESTFNLYKTGTEIPEEC